MSHDYLREIDLNPPAALGGPVINPTTDPRAMHYFGFLAHGQEISNVPPTTAQRVAVSFHYANQPTAVPVMPPPPIDAIVDFAAGPPTVRYEENHDRSHVLVWLDAPLPPLGQPCMVRVRAWARE